MSYSLRIPIRAHCFACMSIFTEDAHLRACSCTLTFCGERVFKNIIFETSISLMCPIIRMSFEDFCRHFTHVDVCHMMNTSFFTLKKTWRESSHTWEWRRPLRAGGCGNHSTFLNNPQVGAAWYNKHSSFFFKASFKHN